MISGGAIALRRPITALPHTTGRPADRVAHHLRVVLLPATQHIGTPFGSRSWPASTESALGVGAQRQLDQLADVVGQRTVERGQPIVFVGAHHLVGDLGVQPRLLALVAFVNSRPLLLY